jgi:hypothetical protein
MFKYNVINYIVIVLGSALVVFGITHFDLICNTLTKFFQL